MGFFSLSLYFLYKVIEHRDITTRNSHITIRKNAENNSHKGVPHIHPSALITESSGFGLPKF